MTDDEFEEMTVRAHYWWDHIATPEVKARCAPWLLAAMFARCDAERDPNQPSSGVPLPERDVDAVAMANMVINQLGMARTDSNLRAVQLALVAEAEFMKVPIREVAKLITDRALKDRQAGGVHIDKWYFEDMKWRKDLNRGRNSKGQFERAKSERDAAIAEIEGQGEVDR